MVTISPYTYLGLNTAVLTECPPDNRWILITGTSPNPYAGLDLFGRVIDCLWFKYSSPTADLARLKYGYNRDSSRQWREDTVGTNFDEYYTYDAVQRLVDMERGTLTGGPPPTGITSATLGQDWDLDATGNWKGFEQTLSDAVTQARDSNMDNEITNITNSVGTAWTTPVYNDGGAMLGMPNAGVNKGDVNLFSCRDRTWVAARCWFDSHCLPMNSSPFSPGTDDFDRSIERPTCQ